MSQSFTFKCIMLFCFYVITEQSSRVRTANNGCSVSSNNAPSTQGDDAATVDSKIQLNTCGKLSLNLENSMSISGVSDSSSGDSTPNTGNSCGCSNGGSQSSAQGNTLQAGNGTASSAQRQCYCSPCGVEKDVFKYPVETYFGLVVDYNGTVIPQCCCEPFFLDQVLFQPTVTYPADPNGLYSFVMLDVDGALQSNMPSVMWVVTNIPGSNVSAGTNLAGYFSPTPGVNGVIRALAIVLRQISFIVVSLVGETIIIAGVSFNLAQFISQYSLTVVTYVAYLVKLLA